MNVRSLRAALAESDWKTARLFLSEGASVIISGQGTNSVDLALKELDPHVLGFVADSGDVTQQKQLAKQVRTSFEELDILFINAAKLKILP